MNNYINNFRKNYPLGTISMKMGDVLSSMCKLNIVISTGPRDGMVPITLVDVDSVAPYAEFQKHKDEALVEALIMAGISGEEEISAPEMPKGAVTDFPAVIDTPEEPAPVERPKRKKKAKLAAEPASEPAETEAAPVDGDEPINGDDETSLKVEEPQEPLSEAVNEHVEAEETSERDASIADTEAEHKPKTVEESVEGETAEESAVGAEEGADADSEHMTLEEAENTILAVVDPAMERRMKEFVGKPLKVISKTRPSLLRFMVRKGPDNGTHLFTPVCEEAARILFEATK